MRTEIIVGGRESTDSRDYTGIPKCVLALAGKLDKEEAKKEIDGWYSFVKAKRSIKNYRPVDPDWETKPMVSITSYQMTFNEHSAKQFGLEKGKLLNIRVKELDGKCYLGFMVIDESRDSDKDISESLALQKNKSAKVVAVQSKKYVGNLRRKNEKIFKNKKPVRYTLKQVPDNRLFFCELS